MIGFGSVKEMEYMEIYGDDGFTDARMSEIRPKEKLIASKCDNFAQSGDVLVYNNIGLKNTQEERAWI